MNNGFLIVEAPRFYAALVIRGGKCVEAPPIWKWALEKPVETITEYCKQEGLPFKVMP